MNELTEHQRSIMQAVLLGLVIQKQHYHSLSDWAKEENADYIDLTSQESLLAVSQYPHALRIAPGQESKAMRLYGFVSDIEAPFKKMWTLPQDKTLRDMSYIDINPTTGAIVGGKL